VASVDPCTNHARSARRSAISFGDYGAFGGLTEEELADRADVSRGLEGAASSTRSRRITSTLRFRPGSSPVLSWLAVPGLPPADLRTRTGRGLGSVDVVLATLLV
jgi:hypothetical protein